MTGLTEQLPHTAAFPNALGTGLLLHTASALGGDLHQHIEDLISDYENVLSRFKGDSIVGQMRVATHGGTFDFPDWTMNLFDLYDHLFSATNGAIDPCVGEDLIRLGYDKSYSVNEPNAAEHTGAIHGRATWDHAIEHHGTTLVTHGPVALDFGACGKGYLVDLIAERLGVAQSDLRYVIDAGGDCWCTRANQSPSPLKIPPTRLAPSVWQRSAKARSAQAPPAADTGPMPPAINSTICSTPSTVCRLTA